MNHKTLSNWGVAAGFLGIIFFILAIWAFYADALMWRLDHKDFYFGGVGLFAIAIWFKMGAIYHKG